ncbi:Uncharacterised protein [uncultured Roseburia sp.]|uniref:DRTGG domain-containing protein n=1 Tax=Brotonthovivens ammoniilytica TaxID=2981725 RepID=A0ABT2TGK3_9FIRM|nr:hypothetical protein [Brotonthovivens ammoniilytica]MCU6761315.1 hypothetical protein [Brotonthovivens ammoniilytica]SCI25068.1 Uncharacterised protein [uncultured Roseburia sp.]
MTIQELIATNKFEIINEGTNLQRTLTEPYCCDLLSIAMGNAPAGCAWCTVMGNMNTLAVASLTEAGCVILCGAVNIDENMKLKARSEGITLLRTKDAIFPAALWIYQQLNHHEDIL